MSWENKPKTAGVFIGFELGVFFFEPWMITLGLTVPFLLNIVILSITGGWNKSAGKSVDGHEEADGPDGHEDDEDNAAGKSPNFPKNKCVFN